MTTPPPAPAAPATPINAPEGTQPVGTAPQPASEPAAPLSLGEPAAPATPEPEAAGTQPVVYDPTGDPGLDIALDFLGKLGLGPEDAAIAAAARGDFAALEAKLKGMGEKAKGFERYLELGKAAYAKEAAAAKAKADADRAAVISAVGDEKTWTAVQTWAAANAEPAEREAVNAALAAGGIAAKAVAKYLHDLWKASPAAVITPAPVTQHAGAGAANGALDPASYKAEVAKLYAAKGGRIDGTPEYADLQRRRAAYR